MENLKIITAFTYPHEAHLAKGFLEANGIEVIIKDELTAQVNNFYSNAIGGVKLLVEAADYEQGLQLLREGGYLLDNETSKIANSEIITMPMAGEKKCPFCESDNIGRKRKVNILILPLYLLLGFLFPIFKRSYKCFDCEKEWKKN